MITNTLDLFCGAGGSSLGAHLAGTSIRLGVDRWTRAIETYSTNFPGLGMDLLMTPRTRARDLGLERGDIQLMLASPECTNHTCAKGSAVRDEESKRTANYVLNFARDLEPRWIVVENVVHMKRWNGYEPLLEGLRKLGYGVTPQTLDASDFGVPQSRRRLFLLCERDHIPEEVSTSGNRPPTVEEILNFRPPSEGGFPMRLVFDADRKPLAKPTLNRFERAVAELGTGTPFLIVYYGSDAAGGWQGLDRPLRTITTVDRFALVTWLNGRPYMRMLQVPELMKAMGFNDQDSYKFLGTRREQIMQLGNGVCPPVMKAVVSHLIPAALRNDPAVVGGVPA